MFTSMNVYTPLRYLLLYSVDGEKTETRIWKTG